MKRFIKHMAIPALCCIMTLTLFRVFFFLGYVPTSSMEPTIRQGSFIVAARMAYWSSEPKVGDIIVFSHDGKVSNEWRPLQARRRGRGRGLKQYPAGCFTYSVTI